jgi:hypothetical protein
MKQKRNFMEKAFRQGRNVEAKAMVPVFIRRDGTARVLSCVLVALALTFPDRLAHAQGLTPVNLGAAASFGVLAGTTVTATGGATVSGNVGVSPGTSITGFPPGTVVNGALHSADATAAAAEAALLTAYNDAAGRSLAPVTVAGNLGGQTLTPGLYKSTSSLAISSGNLTLNAQGNPNAVFIFQIASTLITSSGLQVILSGGANSANIFWQVGSSATLGSTSVFDGTIMALTAITLNTGATLNGRALALNGGVSLDNNPIVTVPTQVPEPGALALVVLGFSLFAWRRRVNQAA